MATETPDLYLDLPETESEHENLQAVPWMALALAVHVLMLVMAWFILPAGPPAHASQVIQAMHSETLLPPEPLQQPEDELQFVHEKTEAEVNEDQQLIAEEAVQPEDATDKPHDSLKESEIDSDKESAHPNPRGTTSAVGLGGDPSGGAGPGGTGGLTHRDPRGRGPGGNPPQVDAALEWLREHQNIEGYWSATTFSEDSARTGAQRTYNIEFMNIGIQGGDRGWVQTVDVGLTGLALLCFTGAGHTHKGSEYAHTIRRGLLWLRKVQENDGCFGPRVDDHFIYNHAICTMAVAEIYAMTADPVLRPMVARATDFILRAQNPGLGWRYGVQPGDNDTSVTGWMVLALHTVHVAGLPVELDSSYADAANWLTVATTDVGGYPKTGYNSPGSDCSRLRSAADVYDDVPSMDTIYIMSMLFMDKADTRDPTVRSLAGECTKPENLPQWKLEKLDFYYWYYASLALYQVGGGQWEVWERAMSKTLLDSQRGFHALDRDRGLISAETLDEHGSWDPVDAWGSAGGRVYATAINCLTLQTYWRHLRQSEQK